MTLYSGSSNAGTDFCRFKLAQLSQDKKFYLALRWYLAGLIAEADLPAPRWPMADGEFPESVQLEAKSVFRQMLNERVFQTRNEDVHQKLSLLLVANLVAA